MKHQPGVVSDAIAAYLRREGEGSVSDIHAAVMKTLGGDVPRSSVRSYLNLNTGSGRKLFDRIEAAGTPFDI